MSTIHMYAEPMNVSSNYHFHQYRMTPTPGYPPQMKEGGSNSEKDRGIHAKGSASKSDLQMWAAFSAAALTAFLIFSGMDFSFLITFGSMSRLFGFLILNYKIFSSNGNTNGISEQTLALFFIVLAFRLFSILSHEGYLPYDKSGDWLYHVIEIMSLVLAIKAFTSCLLYSSKNTVTKKQGRNTVNLPAGIAGLTLLLALLVHPNLNDNFFSDVAWTYATYLESVALLPQIYKFQKNKGQAVDSLLAHFCAALGVGRLLEFLFWLYSHKELANHNGSAAPGYFVILAQLFQLAMMAEFFYFYFKAVKYSTPLVLPVSDSFV